MDKKNIGVNTEWPIWAYVITALTGLTLLILVTVIIVAVVYTLKISNKVTSLASAKNIATYIKSATEGATRGIGDAVSAMKCDPMPGTSIKPASLAAVEMRKLPSLLK
jgi:hypothetical protein